MDAFIAITKAERIVNVNRRLVRFHILTMSAVQTVYDGVHYN